MSQPSRYGCRPAQRTRVVAAIACLTIGLSACSAIREINPLTEPDFSPLTEDPQRLSDSQIDERTEFIEQRLEASQQWAEIWHWFWFGVDVGPGMMLSTYLGATADDDSERAEAIVSGATAALGLVYLYTNPMNARFGAEPVRELPDQTREQQIDKLQRAEIILQENAARARQRDDWLLHVGNLFMAGLSAGIVAAAGGDASQIAVIGGSQLLGGELQFWTEPGAPAEDLEDYERRFLAGQPPPQAMEPGMSVGPRGAGLALNYRF